MTENPKIFVASSGKSKAIAYAVQESLDGFAEVTVWDQNSFALSRSALESLLEILDRFDFAVFVFAPDDQVEMAGNSVSVTRDNVVFELGLFLGRKGRECCYIIQPKDIELHLPSDLAGITTERFTPNRSDNNLRAALGPSINRIREHVKRVLSAQEAESGLEAQLSVNVSALCYDASGPEVKFLLVKSSGRRWLFPKGRRKKKEDVLHAVRRIAENKSGAVGVVDAEAVGSYQHLRYDTNRATEITVFLMEHERSENVAQTHREPTWYNAAGAIAALAVGRSAIYADEFRKIIELAHERVSRKGNGNGSSAC